LNHENDSGNWIRSMDDQRYGIGSTHDKILKIQELKGLVNKHPQYCTDPDGIIKLAIYNSINGDETLLYGKLEQLRTIDSRLNRWASQFTVF